MDVLEVKESKFSNSLFLFERFPFLWSICFLFLLLKEKILRFNIASH